MPSISDTATEMVQFVLPQHAGAPGQIHGGRMMEWIVTVGTMAAARFARGTVALGAMDDIDFLHPVRVGQIAILRAQVEYVGRTSLEVGVRVYAENPATGERAVTLSSHLVFVCVDEQARPRPVADKIEPRGAEEANLVETARKRREERVARFGLKAERIKEVQDEPNPPRWRFESTRVVLPEEALFGNFMFPGKLLMGIDEAGGILCVRYTRGFVMTASMDALDFYSPLRVGDIIVLKAGLNHVGRTSMEVGVKVLAEAPLTGEVRHTCTAFLTFVHLGRDLEPEPVPFFTPEGPGEQRRWEAALVRRQARVARVERLKAAIAAERG
ncbi:MAG: acyl-CoA thioesterase [Candidatus Rokubacteria bacterium]|nr:acyl-CoA thioesterase [Candidatus Rokubacteria bacterium]